MANKIVVLGSLNTDFVMNTPKVPAIGETVSGSGFSVFAGGKGANQAVAAAKQGGNVQMIGCVGDDHFGRNMLRNLRESGVDVTSIRILEHASTGAAVIVVHDGDNFIIVDPGANGELSAHMVDEADSIIRDGSMLLLQLEVPLHTVQRAIEIANRHGTRVILNPAPAQRLPDQFLSVVDVLVLNETECGTLTGIQPDHLSDAEQAAAVLRRKGIGQVILTLGGNGVVFSDGDRIVHKPAYRVDAVDTTAAGDSFIGALAVVLAEGGTIDAAVAHGQAAGALAVTKPGAQSSIPGKIETDAFLLNELWNGERL